MSKQLTDLIIQQAISAEAQLKRDSQQCALAQQKLLHQIMRQNAESFFGHEHHFSKLKTEHDFSRQVPIRDYEGHRPYINKIIAGEKNVLTTHDPFAFHITSGTTSEPKLIPVTLEMMQNNTKVLTHWLARIAKDHPTAFMGNILALVSPAIEGYAGTFPYGNASGNLYRHLPKAISNHYAIPDEVCDIKKYEQRYFMMLRFALEKNITLLVTPNPSTFLRFSAVATQHAETFIRAIHDGILGIELSGSDQLIAQKLQTCINPNPARAKILQAIFAREQVLWPKYIWPHLSLLGCWMGGSVGMQVNNLYQYYGNHIFFRDPGYLASEGRISLPLQDNTPSGVLCLNTNYYEFVPEEINPAESKNTLLAHELEIGKRYNVILTNNAGLYRYDMKDVIEVTGFHYNCPEIMFLRKSRDMTNITGEKLHVNQCIAAMDNILNLLLPNQLIQFSLWPDIVHRRYELAIELDQEQADFDGEKTIKAFDEQLKLENMEYASKRASLRLQAPLLHQMQPGWYEARKRQAIHTGKKDVQYKWVILRQQVDPQDRRYIIKTYSYNKAS